MRVPELIEIEGLEGQKASIDLEKSKSKTKKNGSKNGKMQNVGLPEAATDGQETDAA